MFTFRWITKTPNPAMFLSDPVTIWFRRRSSGSCEDAFPAVFSRPSVADSSDENEGEEGGGSRRDREDGESVFSSSANTSTDSSLVASPCLPLRKSSFSRSTKEKGGRKGKTDGGSSTEKGKKPGKAVAGKQDSGTGENTTKKKGPRMLWRSKSSCADSKTARAISSGRGSRWGRSKNNTDALLDPGGEAQGIASLDAATSRDHRLVIRQHTTPTILLVDGDSPHRLERSLSNVVDFRSPSPLVDSPPSPRACMNLSLSPPPNLPRYFRSPSLSVSPPHSAYPSPSSPLSPSPPSLSRNHSLYSQSLSPPLQHHPPPLSPSHHAQNSSSASFRRKSSVFLNRSSCFDFECIPDKLRSLQDEWRANKQHRKQLSRQEAKVMATASCDSAGGGSQRLSRSSSRSRSRSPRAVSPMPLSYEDYVLYLYSLEGKKNT